MASLAISIPKGYQHKKELEIIAKFNQVEITLNEEDNVITPTLVLADKTEISGIVPVSFALARASKLKNWAKTVLGDGVPDKAASVQQYSTIAETVFTDHVFDIKTTIGQVSIHLKLLSYLCSNELTLADVLLALALYPHAQKLSNEEREQSFVDFTRWIIFINNSLGNPLPQLPVPNFEFKIGQVKQHQGQPQQHQQQGQQHGQQHGQQQGQPKQKKEKPKKQPQPQPAKQEIDDRDPFSFIDVRIGKIVKVWPHPNADTLYCEEIDIGNGQIKKVVTGVRNFVPIEEMQDRHVVVSCNIKPSKIRGMPSESMVFAGSNGDHTVVELLDPPADAPIGTRIVCGDFVKGEVPGIDKKGKYWEAVAENHNLTINGDHLACYKGVPLSCEYGQIRVKSLANCEFH